MKLCKTVLAVLGSLALLSVVGASADERSKVYLVSNAHLDTQWNWDVRTTIGEYIPNTMERNFALFAKYPFYIFNFEGGVKYAWMKEYYPAEYELVKKYIAEGRWHISGASWDATDPNMPSAESFCRNILYGQKFYQQEFGVLSTDIFLPDCFGFSYTLPSIAAHFGLIGFSTQKLQWRSKPFYGDKKTPFPLGLWQGIDGSRIMMADDCLAYNTNRRWKNRDLVHDKEILQKVSDSSLGMAVRYFGTGDIGGSATVHTMNIIDKALKADGPMDFHVVTSDQVYKDYMPFAEHPELPVWNGELLMDVHATGCYTSRTAMKAFNRRNEQMADAAERACVAAGLVAGYPYPAEALETAWKRFIWHQFHDDLTGTSIPEAYVISHNDERISLSQFSAEIAAATDAIAAKMDTRTSGDAYIVYNPCAFPRREVISLEGGRPVMVNVAPMSWSVVDGRSAAAKGSCKVSAADGGALENSLVRVRLDANGDICSIYDKETGKEAVAEGKSVRLALFIGNESTSWPSWEIMKATLDREPSAISQDVKVEVFESSALRSSLRITRSYGSSTFEQIVSITEGSARVDVDNVIDWHETDALLKAEFPLAVSNPEAWYDLGLGAVKRDNNTETKYEVYAHKWAGIDAQDGSYGVAVMNDCKYGWDKPADNVIRLTLLHNPAVKDRYVYQAVQDHGVNKFRYSILAHKDTWQNAGVYAQAEAVNQPIQVFAAAKHAGTLGRSVSLAQVKGGAIAIRAFKRAEDGDGYVLRVHETAGASQSAQIAVLGGVVSCEELDGMERKVRDMTPVDGVLPVEIGPFGIKTYRVRVAGAAAPAVSTPVALPYNAQYATYNGFRDEVKLDDKGTSYPAELIPASLTVAGAEFPFADPADDSAVRCEQQRIALPCGGKLLLLAASTAGDADVEFVFEVAQGKKTTTKAVKASVAAFDADYSHGDIALSCSHKHDGKKDVIYEFANMYLVTLDIPAGATSVVFPDNKSVLVFSAAIR